MMDQACTLRRLAAVATPRLPDSRRRAGSPGSSPAKIISVTSGKGGVGKTHLVVNLAYALRRCGLRVMIVDADLGLANVDVLLGLTPRFNIQHVLSGRKSLA